MRISDWSSDVCSSDLCGEGDASHNLNDFTEGGSRPRCWNWIERFGSDFLHIFTLLKLPFFYQPRLLRRNSFEQLAGRLITWILRHQLAAHRQLQDQLAQLPRSEEHTSELQSLMRISYAVFCLKK